MTGDNNKIPLPPAMPSKVEQSAEQTDRDFLKDDEWQGTDIQDKWLDFTVPYTKPDFVFSFRGRPFARLGDVQIVSGQAGHGKSMLFSQFITAILKGEFGELRYELSEKPKVLLIDTEQSIDDVIAGKNRVMELCGYGLQEPRDDFRVIMLRDTDTAIERWKMTLEAIYEVKPNIIILDGLLDVVNDFNDQIKCAELIYKCMRVASHYKAAMMCVLHQNPLSAKLTGHLGSAAMRKVTDIIVVIKEKMKNGDVRFTVKEDKARGHQDFEDWQFRVLPVSLWGRPEQITANSHHEADISIEEIERCLREGAEDVTWPAFGKDIQKVFRERGNIKGNDKLQECIKRAQNKRLIIPQPDDEREPGQRYPKYNLNID